MPLMLYSLLRRVWPGVLPAIVVAAGAGAAADPLTEPSNGAAVTQVPAWKAHALPSPEAIEHVGSPHVRLIAPAPGLRPFDDRAREINMPGPGESAAGRASRAGAWLRQRLNYVHDLTLAHSGSISNLSTSLPPPVALG